MVCKKIKKGSTNSPLIRNKNLLQQNTHKTLNQNNNMKITITFYLWSYLFHNYVCFNVEVNKPIVITSSLAGSESLFGYSIQLEKDTAFIGDIIK